MVKANEAPLEALRAIHPQEENFVLPTAPVPRHGSPILAWPRCPRDLFLRAAAGAVRGVPPVEGRRSWLSRPEQGRVRRVSARMPFARAWQSMAAHSRRRWRRWRIGLRRGQHAQLAALEMKGGDVGLHPRGTPPARPVSMQ